MSALLARALLAARDTSEPRARIYALAAAEYARAALDARDPQAAVSLARAAERALAKSYAYAELERAPLAVAA